MRFVELLEAQRIPYAVGGSMASGIHGEPRATHDVDVLIELRRQQVRPLVASLEREFYVDESSVSEAVVLASSFNAVHRSPMYKIDVFVAGRSLLDRKQLERRVARALSDDAPKAVYVTSAEDIVLRKLLWFRSGGEISDRQWRDVLGVLKASRARMDLRYMADMARELQLEDLLRRALDQASSD